ncbi:hypothetical protein PPACK8108_LOCUS22724 [Phakopsora pachyrhizi]|uniref:Uncharacterized protein n=1 Tax=Phakopsora pachyrhizi TaxID=170000 RepID=A0AAV0BKM3_PHAPC|nr:hypothetical protein PPACK8108_LOCUS22724 [Phakopsora pachyrhizi]
MPRPRRNSFPAPFSAISSLPSNIGPPPSPNSGLSPALYDFSTESTDWMDGTNGFTAVKQVSKVKCKFSEPTETRGPLVWCNPTIQAYEYEHPIARTPTEYMDSGVFSKCKLMVAVGIPSEQIVRVPKTSGGLSGSHELDFLARANLMKHQAAMDLAQKEVEDAQEYLRNEALPLTFDHPSEDVLEFENDKERARRLLVNTHRLLGAHVGKMVKGASNHWYSEFVQRGLEMDGLLTHAITQLSDWYETLEVENYEGFEWDDSHGKRKAEDSP